VDRRIFGLETEYGVACTSGGTRRLTPDEVARYLFRRVVTWGRSSNVFLRNGSRIYLDVGSHPEYATAECDDLIQLINHDRAGERILEDLIVDAEHIWESVSSATTRSRPIINTRDEPHADPERYRRLHVIVGDSNMSETTTLLKVGSAELVLRLIEAGVPMRDFTLENPIRAIRDMSRDRTGQVKVALSNGRRVSALELQTEYYEKVSEFVRRESLGTRIVDRVLDLWERTLRAVAEDKLALIDTEIDWAIKLKLLDRYSVKHRLGFSDPRIAQLDLAYHDIRRSRGVFSLLEERGLAARVTTDPSIFRAKAVPPQTTRAKLRGDFIRAAQEGRHDYTVDWVHLKLNDQAQRTVLCKDPFVATDDRVERLIASMRS
jgi:proteasome accessory factor A